MKFQNYASITLCLTLVFAFTACESRMKSLVTNQSHSTEASTNPTPQSSASPRTDPSPIPTPTPTPVVTPSPSPIPTPGPIAAADFATRCSAVGVVRCFGFDTDAD